MRQAKSESKINNKEIKLNFYFQKKNIFQLLKNISFEHIQYEKKFFE